VEITVSGKEPPGWNAFLASNRGTFHQSTFNVDYLQPLGFEPLYFAAEEGSRRVGQLLAFKTAPLHAASLGTAFEAFLPLGKRMFPTLQEIYGPVAESEGAYEALVSRLAGEARKTGASISIAKPHPLRDYPQAFEKSGFSSRQSATFIIDLSKTEQELWNGVSASARRKVTRAASDGAIARIAAGNDDAEKYFAIVDENRKRNGLRPYSRKSQFGMWAAFKKSGGRLIVAEKGGELLGGIMISTMGGYVNEWSPSISASAMSRKIYAGDLLHWEVIKWGRENGCKHYDLTGVAVRPKDRKEEGIYEFKAKWGGRLAISGEYSLEGGSVLHGLLKKAKAAYRKVGNKGRVTGASAQASAPDALLNRGGP